jgi:hypothetical protein
VRFRLHSDRSYLTSGAPYVPILIPLWGRTPELPDFPGQDRFEAYAERGSSMFEFTSLADCDAAIFPQSWEHVMGDEVAESRAAAFVALAADAGKQAVIFNWSDSAAPVELAATIFRTSLYRSRRRRQEFAQPAWSEDLVDDFLGGTLPLRTLGPRPLVGFCGSLPREPAAKTAWARLRRRVGDRRRKVGAARGNPVEIGYVRSRALDLLESHPGVDTNIVLRETFWAGMGYGPDALEARTQARREYVQNIVESDYVLCARGAGNFSYRLYETLCCGRIPIFIDTDCVLPLESSIDWKRYCVWVDESDVGRIGDRVAAFHASLQPREFEDRQRACRTLWETHLSPQGFFAHFHEHFA